MSILTVGINHTTAPVEVRERVVFDAKTIPETLRSLLKLPGVAEAAVLSTCNRTEVTCWHDQDDSIIQIPDWLSEHHNISATEITPYLYNHNDGEAVRHLLRVACGLDSMVLGEPQILGQLKSAYQQASESDTLGRYLNRLYQTTFQTAKKIRTETEIGSSAVSVAFAAVSLAKQIFGNLNEQTALLIGAGETIELTARHLKSQNIKHLLIANRTLSRAEQLSEQFDAQPLSLIDVNSVLDQADIVISSTASSLPVLGKGAVERALKKRKHRPMFMVDIAVPRDIEPETGDLPDVYLYTVDDLHDVIAENMRSRRKAAEQAEELVDAQVHDFMGWLKSQDAIHLVKEHRNQATEIQSAVTAQAMQMLAQGKSAEEALKFLSHNLTNKLIHSTTYSLNRAAHEGDEALLSSARQLLNLGEQPNQTKPARKK